MVVGGLIGIKGRDDVRIRVPSLPDGAGLGTCLGWVKRSLQWLLHPIPQVG